MKRKRQPGRDFDERLALALDANLGGRQDTSEYVDLARLLSRLSPPGPDPLAVERTFALFKASTAHQRGSLIPRQISRLSIAERFAAAGLVISVVGLGAQASGVEVFAGVRRGAEVLSSVAGALIPENGSPPSGATIPGETQTPQPGPTGTVTTTPTSSAGPPRTIPPAGASSATAAGPAGSSPGSTVGPPVTSGPSGSATPPSTPDGVTPAIPATSTPAVATPAAAATPTATQTHAPSPSPLPSTAPEPTFTPAPTSTTTPATPTVPATTTPVPTPTTAPAPIQETFQAGIAGFVTLRVFEGRLEVIAVIPNDGWVVTEPQVTATAVHFKFVNGRAEVEFEATLEGGRIQPQVSSNGQVP